MLGIELEESGSVDPGAELEILASESIDISEAVRGAVVEVIQRHNRADRLAGRDRDGQPLIPLAASTMKRRKGLPTPLDEHGEASRAIRNLVVVVEGGPGRVSIRLNWPGAEFLAFQARGAGRLPIRDVLGLSPEAEAEVRAVIVAEADRAVAEMIRRPRGLSRFLGGFRR